MAADREALPRQSAGRTVYAVSSGEYSDYYVGCVFERREDAERYVEVGLGDRIEEMTLYSEMPTIYTAYTATITKRGGPWGQAGALRTSDYRTVGEPQHKPSETDWDFSAIGPDRERVLKSVSDRYAAWKAQQEGVA